MPQDRRTRKFKQDREDRLKNREARVQFTDDQIIEDPQPHVENPSRCIWCDFGLDGKRAVCPQCYNCQSCRMLQPVGGFDRCLLCGNHVPEKKVQTEVPTFKRIRGQRGFVKRMTPGPGHRRGKGLKAP